MLIVVSANLARGAISGHYEASFRMRLYDLGRRPNQRIEVFLGGHAGQHADQFYF